MILLYSIPILPYLIIINIWLLLISIKNINFSDIKNNPKEYMNIDTATEKANVVADKGLIDFDKKLPYILKLVPTIIILYFYFR